MMKNNQRKLSIIPGIIFSMDINEIQGYITILSPLAITIVAMSIFTLQDKKIKTYTLGEIAKDRNAPPKKQKGVFDMQKTATYTEGDNT